MAAIKAVMGCRHAPRLPSVNSKFVNLTVSFRSPGGLQRFIAVFSAVRNLIVPPRSRRSALAAHLHRLNAVAQWKAVAGIAA
jgi:hypothetical protein